MNEELLSQIKTLRSLVSFLMEKRSWWHTSFHDSSARDFLAYIFPKSNKEESFFSYDAIQYATDKEVGANYYHLFRLPISIEERINRESNSIKNEEMESEELAIKALLNISNGLSVDQNPGPKNIGNIDQLDQDIIQVFAAEYCSAFVNNYQVHPYLN